MLLHGVATAHTLAPNPPESSHQLSVGKNIIGVSIDVGKEGVGIAPGLLAALHLACLLLDTAAASHAPYARRMCYNCRFSTMACIMLCCCAITWCVACVTLAPLTVAVDAVLPWLVILQPLHLGKEAHTPPQQRMPGREHGVRRGSVAGHLIHPL